VTSSWPVFVAKPMIGDSPEMRFARPEGALSQIGAYVMIRRFFALIASRRSLSRSCLDRSENLSAGLRAGQRTRSHTASSPSPDTSVSAEGIAEQRPPDSRTSPGGCRRPCIARRGKEFHMANKMLIDASHPEETRVVVLRGNKVQEFDFEAADKRPLRGNIYLAKVTRVEPSLQAAFVDYGGNRHGFLAFAEIHPTTIRFPSRTASRFWRKKAAHTVSGGGRPPSAAAGARPSLAAPSQ